MSDTHAQTVTFVRDTMLPEREPPVTEAGAIKWVRENLLSSWLNIVLTVLSLIVIYLVLSAMVPWFLNSVWNARSLNECREVFLVSGATGGGGACWAVIQERGIQLLYGFYPSDLRWRPNLTFVLFFFAIAPILFADRVPRQFLWLTALFPFVMPWLLWGGAFWTPLLAMAGFAVGYGLFLLGKRLNGNLLGALMGIFGALIWWAILLSPIDSGLHRMMAGLRADSVSEQAQQTIAQLRPELAALEGEREAVRARITALEAVKNEAIVPIEEATTQAREEAIAAYYAAAGVDPATDEIGTAMRENAEHEGQVAAAIVAKSDALRTPRETALDTITALTKLRNEVNLLSTQIGIRETDIRDARTLRSNLALLPQRRVEIAELEAAMPGLEAAVPEELRALNDAANAPDDTSPEDVASLRTLVDARDTLNTLESSVELTYREAGRIGLEPVADREFGGFMLALIIGLSGIILSLPLGIVLALGRQSDLFLINKVSVAFIEVIRGVPLIVWLLVAQTLLNYFLPPGTNFSLLLRVIIMVTLFASAYIAEVVRGGLAALPRGQYEAADALGLDYFKSMRLIILPQALKISIPGIVNTFIGLFKDTTLVVFIGLLDPIGLTNAIRASTDWNGVYWEPFIFIAVLFFIACYAMGRYSFSLEKKLTREHR